MLRLNSRWAGVDLGLRKTCLQLLREHLHKPIQDSLESALVSNYMKLRLQFKFSPKNK